jgi:tetratricopeptide (TPR) repeat protein
VLDQLIRIGRHSKDDSAVFAYLSQAMGICSDIHDNARRERYEKERNLLADLLARKSPSLRLIPEVGAHQDPGTELAHLVMRNPRVVDLIAFDVKDADISLLKSATRAEAIIMPEQNVTDKGLEFLSNLQHVKMLNLRHTGVSNLKPLLSLRNTLETLNLKKTLLSSDGMTVIGQLTKLYDLDLSDTGIDDADLKQLYNLHLLRTLRLTNCHVTQTGLDQLHHALPQMRIGEPRTYTSLQKETSSLIAEHRYSEALQDISETLRIATMSPSNRAMALEEKAVCQSQLNQFDLADKTYVECLALLKEELPDERRVMGEKIGRQKVIFDHACKALIQGKPRQADELVKFALKVGPNPRGPSSFLNEGDCQLAFKHIQRAQDCYFQCERLVKEAPDVWWSAVIAGRQAKVCEQLKQFDRAITLRLLAEERTRMAEDAVQAVEGVRIGRLGNLRALVADCLESTGISSAARAHSALQQIFTLSAGYGLKPDSNDAVLIERVGVKLSKEGNHQAALTCFLNEQALLKQHPELVHNDSLKTRLPLEIERERRSCSDASGAK